MGQARKFLFDVSFDQPDPSPDAGGRPVEPTFSQTDTLQMGGEYRRRFENGNLQLDGSITHADLLTDTGIDRGQQWRGDLFGTFLYNINDTWRAGSDIQYASDKSYLERYQIGSEQQLVNRAYVEGFSGRDYAAVKRPSAPPYGHQAPQRHSHLETGATNWAQETYLLLCVFNGLQGQSHAGSQIACSESIDFYPLENA